MSSCKKSLSSLLLLCLILPLCCAGEVSSDAAACEPFRDFSFVTPEGDELTLSAVRQDKPLFLVLFATWCPDCTAFLPQLETFAGEQGDAVSVIALSVSADDTPQILSAYRKEHALSFPMGCAEPGMAEFLHIEWIPTLIVLDSSGMMLCRYGEELSELDIFPKLTAPLMQSEN